jgi:hypothetical protein
MAVLDAPAPRKIALREDILHHILHNHLRGVGGVFSFFFCLSPMKSMVGVSSFDCEHSAWRFWMGGDA